ncbi:hypothetical protein, partial [Acetobacter sp. LMG 32666]|uniref:hypothetical protein n=1 Tax=Acetobacter sp. LMG 32666 TaxID=2959295 RepID=UPI0030C88B7E
MRNKTSGFLEPSTYEQARFYFDKMQSLKRLPDFIKIPKKQPSVTIRRETRAYSGGDGIVDLLVGFPVPGQEF